MNTTTSPTRSAVPAGTERRHAIRDSPIGPLTLVAHGDRLAGVYFADHSRRPSAARLGARCALDGVLVEAAAQLAEYFAGTRRAFELSTAAVGSDFQRRVWAQISAIGYGERTSYGAITARLGLGAEQARYVGGAVGANPLSIVVPCHRVLGSDGRLVGYAGGLDRKAFLLSLEEPPAASLGRLF